MFNKRWKRILAWSLSVVLVLVIGGLFAANYVVDRLMSSMADGLNVETEETINTDQVAGTVSTTAPAPTASNNLNASTESATPVATQEVVSKSQEPAANEKTPKDQVKQDTPVTAQPKTKQTTQPASTPSPTKETNLDGYSSQVSTDKAKHIQDNVTVKDKADVVSIVLGQLSVSDIKRLQELASGGLTVEEKREARSIILGKVSDEQYNQLSQIAKKYGVSEGKTHDQVLAEEEQLKAQEKGSE
ncbi:hypothetical protein [Paenibacillus sp. HW567]|uniref:hypothetical protein n=1 Tax=Paenibacillus sp. HW567 TaxID=1034769 RepID=UPI0003788067|nr:hypothetical protein [Paenibacillus sp. HW567]